MKKIIRLTESDLTRLVKRVLAEQSVKLPGTGEDPNTHRYDAGVEYPGFEKFLGSPNDSTITNGLLNQLRKDPFGKGKIVIIFNGEKFKDPQSFISKIRLNADAGKCFTITDYNYNNRVALNTRITIKATIGECKKAETPNTGTTPPKSSEETKPTPTPAPKKQCKYKLQIPFYGEGKMSETEIRRFQGWCQQNTGWTQEFSDGTNAKCVSKSDGIWGCCTATCWYKYGKNYSDYLRNQQGNDNVGRGANLQTGDYRKGRDY
jgi:hypothetical protein